MKLPLVTVRECIRALVKAGFYVHHQTGSHIILRRDHPPGRVVVPNKSPIPRGTLRSILRQARLTDEEFIALLER